MRYVKQLAVLSFDAYSTVFNAVHPKEPDGIADRLIWCEPENISPEGVLPDS